METMGPHKQATVRSINLFVTVACHSLAFQLPLVPSASLKSNCRSMHLVRFSSLHPCNVPYWKICLSVANRKYVIPIRLCVLWSTQRVWAAPKVPPILTPAPGSHRFSLSKHVQPSHAVLSKRCLFLHPGIRGARAGRQP